MGKNGKRQDRHIIKPHDKLNKTIKKLKELLKYEQNKAIEEYFENLLSTEATDYSLWRLTKKIKKGPQQFIPPIRQINDK